MIKTENNFNHIKKQCYKELKIVKKEIEQTKNLNKIFEIFSNEYFLMSLILLGSILAPAFVVVLRVLKSNKSETQKLILIQLFVAKDIEIPISTQTYVETGKEILKSELEEYADKKCDLVVVEVE